MDSIISRLAVAISTTDTSACVLLSLPPHFVVRFHDCGCAKAAADHLGNGCREGILRGTKFARPRPPSFPQQQTCHIPLTAPGRGMPPSSPLRSEIHASSPCYRSSVEVEATGTTGILFGVTPQSRLPRLAWSRPTSPPPQRHNCRIEAMNHSAFCFSHNRADSKQRVCICLWSLQRRKQHATRQPQPPALPVAPGCAGPGRLARHTVQSVFIRRVESR